MVIGASIMGKLCEKGFTNVWVYDVSQLASELNALADAAGTLVRPGYRIGGMQ